MHRPHQVFGMYILSMNIFSNRWPGAYGTPRSSRFLPGCEAMRLFFQALLKGDKAKIAYPNPQTPALNILKSNLRSLLQALL